MIPIIEKKPRDPSSFVFPWRYFDSARSGLKRIFTTGDRKQMKILIPAYIGYSSKEGSGVFDPIHDTGLEVVFYRLNRQLHIDPADIASKIQDNPGQMLLLIHYFGFIDPGIAAVKQLAGKHDMVIIEDFAHALYTFWMNPEQDFDFAVFSIHKMFPEASGGLVLTRHSLGGDCLPACDLFRYNIPGICRRRLDNYRYLLGRATVLGPPFGVEVLRPSIDGAVPQTFPILLPDTATRDALYFGLNHDGFGVVSLYHRLIDAIAPRFTVEHDISGRILNLPVHQDVSEKALEKMLRRAGQILDAHFQSCGGIQARSGANAGLGTPPG